MSRFAPGTQVRLTGQAWDSEYPTERGLHRGMVVTIEECDLTEGVGAFKAGLDTIPWYVDTEGQWAAEAVNVSAAREAAEAALRAYDEAAWGEGRQGAASAVADALRDLLAETKN